MKNFWNEMKKSSDSAQGKPIFCLAPMADVTDAAFRFIIAKYSKGINKVKYVTYTEFVSADGLALAPEKGRAKLLKDLEYSEIERPIVAQFFTSNPDHMYKAAMLAMELGPTERRDGLLGFDGVDINMGCPDKSIEKQGAGAALIKNPKLTREIISAAKAGIREAAQKLKKEEIPVSIKTRLGYNKDELETWLPEILAENPAAVVVHARTRKEMSKVPASWERIKRAVEIRNDIYDAGIKSHSKTLIIGNGDVLDIEDGRRKCEESGADGAMLGRAVFGNPWLFASLASIKPDGQIKGSSEALVSIGAKVDISIEDRLKVLIEHTKLFEEKFKGLKNFAIMKKHFKSYLSGLPSAKEWREQLMQTQNAKEVEDLISSFLA